MLRENPDGETGCGAYPGEGSTVYAWAEHGTLPSFKINGLLRFDHDEVMQWLKGCKRPEHCYTSISKPEPGKEEQNKMGLYKRGNAYWFDVCSKGTGTGIVEERTTGRWQRNVRKVLTDIVEGRYFETN